MVVHRVHCVLLGFQFGFDRVLVGLPEEAPPVARVPGMPPHPMNSIGFGAMAAPRPYEFIGFGAMAATRHYEFIRFGAMDAISPSLSRFF